MGFGMGGAMFANFFPLICVPSIISVYHNCPSYEIWIVQFRYPVKRGFGPRKDYSGVWEIRSDACFDEVGKWKMSVAIIG